LSLYRVHFSWKNKEVTLSAGKLDMTHPYFVSIKDIILPKASSLIIDPNRENFEKIFGRANHLMIPFQSVSLIEELDKEAAVKDSKVSSFSIVEVEKSKFRNE
jgi:hypothetical protein